MIHSLPDLCLPALRVSLPLRLGAVSFLNTRPLVWALEEQGDKRLQLSFDHPAALAEQLDSGRIDVGLIPVAEALRGVGECAVAGVSIASQGPVWSVRLFARELPKGGRHNLRRVGVDYRSRSSVELLRLLCRELEGPEITFEPIDPATDLNPEGLPLSAALDGALVIGDRALDLPGGWDLGAAWTEGTGLPFVYALWMARTRELAAVLGPHLRAARDWGLTHLSLCLQRDPLVNGRHRERVEAYLREAIDYRLTAAHRQALRLYARRIGLRRDLVYEEDSNP